MISLFRSLGFLVEGAPKGNYDVELIMSQYKSCSVFKRYYVPLLSKQQTESKVCYLLVNIDNLAILMYLNAHKVLFTWN